MAKRRYANHESRWTEGPGGSHHETGIFEHQGRKFSAGGSVIDTRRGLVSGYPKLIAESAERGARYALQSWGGRIIAPLRLTGTFKTPGFGGFKNKIWAWQTIIEGRVYSGRNSGPGMLLRMRAGRDASKSRRIALKHARYWPGERLKRISPERLHKKKRAHGYANASRYRPDWATMSYAQLRAAYVGKRIEIPPHYDLWMRGARYGTVKNITRDGQTVLVKMDHPQVRRLVRVQRPDWKFVG